MSLFSLLYFSLISLRQDSFVLQSLEFDLIVYAPYRSVEGFISVMEVSFDTTLVFHFVQNSFFYFLLGTILK